jgi:hypothetical protein
MAFKHSATLRFDFKTPEHAVIAARSMSVDEDLKPSESTSTFSAVGTFMVLEIQSASPKFLKKAITTTLPSVDLIERTINEFAID